MVDWDRVQELQSEFGEDGFAEVVGLFLEEADEVVADLAAGLPGAEVESRLHFLKGSALNLGLSDLAALCQSGERKAAVGHGAEVDLLQVATCYRKSKALFLEAVAASAA